MKTRSGVTGTQRVNEVGVDAHRSAPRALLGQVEIRGELIDSREGSPLLERPADGAGLLAGDADPDQGWNGLDVVVPTDGEVAVVGDVEAFWEGGVVL